MTERLIDRVRAVADWERDNPALAAAWNEALREKRGRERMTHLQRHTAEQEARAPEFLRSCGLEPREIGVLLGGNLRKSKPMEAVAQFLLELDKKLEDRKQFLLLAGEVGCGKTIAACSYFLAHGRTRYHDPDLGDVWQWADRMCQYRLAPELARSGLFGDEERRDEARVKGCRALVIDELGAEVMTEIWLSRLESVVDARYRMKLPTILCTNLDRANFQARYGSRIWRRVREAGMSPRLEAAQEDRRVAG